MSQSFYQLRCPHCQHESRDSCGGWGVIGKEVTLCANCHRVFPTLANSYNWKTIGGTRDDEDQPSRPVEAGPTDPTTVIRAGLQGQANQLLADHQKKHAPPDLDARFAAAKQAGHEILVKDKATGEVRAL